jgi:citrate lyase subunit beta/citryl-CoA lyase
MIEKAARSDADAICIDLEDSVAAEQKAEARTNAARAFSELDFGRKLRMLRVNATDTPWTFRDLVDVVGMVGDHLDLVMLPKAGSPNDVGFVDLLLSQIERERGFAQPVGLEVQIETAAGFVWLREIAQASPRVEALVFGPGDYAASLHMPTSAIGVVDEHDASYPGHRWHAAMHAIVATARAFGLRCLDGPFAAHQDLVGLERVAGIARALGFDGKQCIHPAQVPVVRRVFGPSEEELAHARRVIEASDRAAADGRGAVSLDGTMIDAASVRIARAMLARQGESSNS